MIAAIWMICGQGTFCCVLFWGVRKFGPYTTELRKYRDEIVNAREAILYAHETNRIMGEKLVLLLRETQLRKPLDDGTCSREERSA